MLQFFICKTYIFNFKILQIIFYILCKSVKKKLDYLLHTGNCITCIQAQLCPFGSSLSPPKCPISLKPHYVLLCSSAYLSVNATLASLLSALTKMAEDFTYKNKRELHVPLLQSVHRQNKQYFNLVKKGNKLNKTKGIFKGQNYKA